MADYLAVGKTVMKAAWKAVQMADELAGLTVVKLVVCSAAWKAVQPTVWKTAQMADCSAG